MMLETLYWLCLAFAFYPYLGYPVIAFLLARLWPRLEQSIEHAPQPVSIVVACYNEAQRIGRRVGELSRLAAAVHSQSEVIVVSDGSTDDTARVVESLSVANVRFIALPFNQGKANALNKGVAAARCDLVAFADTRQTWDDETLPRLLTRFADPKVGAVSGDLRLRTASGGLASVDFYWRLEKWLRLNESRWHSSIGVTGAVCALRRARFTTLPTGTVLDDVYWPMAVILQGWRVVHEPLAAAYDELPDQISGEYQRKLRTLAGNFQLLTLMPSLLVPWKNPVWLQFVSHKLMRLVTPWLLLAVWGLSFVLAANWKVYAVLCMAQSLLLVAGLVAWMSPPIHRIRPLGILAGVFALNYAAWLAFWVWLTGGTTRAWKKVEYRNTEPTSVPSP